MVLCVIRIMVCIVYFDFCAESIYLQEYGMYFIYLFQFRGYSRLQNHFS